MGRGKIKIERIVNATGRSVTFSKRRKGLLKKAKELSILCDIQVGVMIFSTTGKLYNFASNASIKETIEQYGKLKGDQPHLYWKNEASILQQQLQSVLESHRQVVGEKQLCGMSIQELKSLEHRLEMNLKCIRMKKDEIMMAEIEEQLHKENLIQQENLDLRRQAMCQDYSAPGPKRLMTAPLHTDELNWEDNTSEDIQLQPKHRDTEFAHRNIIIGLDLN